MNILPPMTELFTDDEITMTFEEEVRLLDDRPRNVRWFSAPHTTPAPVPEVCDGEFAPGWPPAWLPLNDAGGDGMCGVLIAPRPGTALSGTALLILTNPTERAREVWEISRLTSTPVALAVERIEGGGYRAHIPRAQPIHPVLGTAHLRFTIPLIQGKASWEVFTAGGLV